ncbi:MAG: hypothetical protein U0271_32295 [Polyangiaceae bacterium]
MAGTKDVFVVQLYFARVSGEVLINGVPVWSVPKDLGATDQTLPINGYLVSGTNTVELVVDIDAPPSKVREKRQNRPDPEASAAVRIVRFPGGGRIMPTPDAGTVVVAGEWLSDRDKGEESPRSLSWTFEVLGGGGPWSFQSAPKLVIDEATIEETRVLLEEVRSALRAGDVAALMALGAIRFREVGEAFGATDDSADIARLTRWVELYKNEPDRVLPIDPRQFDLRLCADDKLLLAVNSDWSHCVRLRQDVTDQDNKPAGEFEAPYEIFAARIGGKLKIVR